MKTFKHFIHEALDFAFDLYMVVGGIVLLFIVYGFLWLIISMIWKKIHKQSHDYVVDTVLGVFGKNLKEEIKEDAK